MSSRFFLDSESPQKLLLRGAEWTLLTLDKKTGHFKWEKLSGNTVDEFSERTKIAEKDFVWEVESIRQPLFADELTFLGGLYALARGVTDHAKKEGRELNERELMLVNQFRRDSHSAFERELGLEPHTDEFKEPTEEEVRKGKGVLRKLLRGG